jgi:glucose-1-phosphate adenylyltransferase
MQLTQWRAKPAMPFGGKFRIVDFPLSNCINSGIRRIGVVTQYMAHPLILHVQRGWGSGHAEFGEFVELLPAQQRTGASWYAGTADAIYQNIDIIRRHDPEYVLILAGDHVYKMDYGEMIAHHVKHQADMTVGCIEFPAEEATELGIMTVNEEGWVVRFTEKPKHPESIPGRDGIALASMGIYIFNINFLYDQLIRDHDLANSSHDFGKDVIPYAIDKYKVHAYPFQDSQGKQVYWRDVGTVDAFWEANLELIDIKPELNLYDDTWPIWTYQAQLPPAKFVFDDDNRRGMAVDSMVSGGCIMSGSAIRHSLLFSNVKVHSYAKVQNSVILPDVDIARHAVVNHAVVDEGCRIPEGMIIGMDPEEDRRRFYVSEKGVVLVTPEMLGQELHRVR